MTAPQHSPRIAPAALEFQGALDRLIAEPLPRALRLWPLCAALGLLALALAAAVLPVDVVVIASGRLAADAPAILLKPMSRAVLTELHVRPGDVVSAGQLLARLDPTLPAADRATLASERRSVAAEIARIEAEMAGQAPPQGNSESRLQADLQARRADLAAGRHAALSAEESALNQELTAAEAATEGLQERLSIARQIETLRADLAARRIGSHLEELAARAARLSVEAELAQHHSHLAALRRQIRAVQDERTLLDNTERRDAAEALPPLRLHLAQLDDALAKADRLSQLSDLTAPRDAVVVSVAPGGIGAVMVEGEAVIALIPRDAPLVAEISIPVAEAGSVAPGDPVTLKLDAFSWRRHGSAGGTLQSLSPTTLTPPGKTAAEQPARVAALTPPPGLPPGAELQPGMTLSAEIRTGHRSVLDFFLDPLMRGLSESLREP